MAVTQDIRVFTHRNAGTAANPEWQRYFIKSLADCIYTILPQASDSEIEAIAKKLVVKVGTDEAATTKYNEDLAALKTAIKSKGLNIEDYVDKRISALVGGASDAYDTLKELEVALSENSESLSNTLLEKINTKADQSAVLYTNSTKTLQAHGGVPAGKNFDKVPITDVLDMILYPWVAPAVSAKVVSPANGGTYEKGNNQSVTSISITVTKKSSNITKVEIYNGSTVLGTKSGTDLNTLNTNGTATFTFTVSVTVSANTTFTAKVTDATNAVTSANTGTFSFVYPYYYGVIGADDTADATTIKGLTKVVQAKGNKSFQFTANNQKMVYASPNATISKIIDPNNFDVTSTFTHSTVSITGLDGTAQTYHVYTNAASTVTDFKMTFNH